MEQQEIRDDELAARWLQLGVFSPILRLHSSNNDFNRKESWVFNKEAEVVMKRARFRCYLPMKRKRAAGGILETGRVNRDGAVAR